MVIRAVVNNKIRSVFIIVFLKKDLSEIIKQIIYVIPLTLFLGPAVVIIRSVSYGLVVSSSIQDESSSSQNEAWENENSKINNLIPIRWYTEH